MKRKIHICKKSKFVYSLDGLIWICKKCLKRAIKEHYIKGYWKIRFKRFKTDRKWINTIDEKAMQEAKIRFNDYGYELPRDQDILDDIYQNIMEMKTNE